MQNRSDTVEEETINIVQEPAFLMPDGYQQCVMI
jgi:hypothetical protein